MPSRRIAAIGLERRGPRPLVQRKFGLDETGTIDLTTAAQLQAIAHGMAHHA